MRLSLICWRIFLALFGPALVATSLLYLYPAVLGCSFPAPPSTLLQNGTSSSPSNSIAAFRLLVLADPQLEGDTSLPDPHAPLLPSVQLFLSQFNDHNSTLYDTYDLLTSLASHDIPTLLYSARKRVDLIGNDYYLAHIYRTLFWYTRPTHVTVLGDLLGSQWISDDEFEYRGWRYWNRVFRHGQRVEENITKDMPKGHREVLGADKDWNRRIINVAGNHDVGYAGDFSEQRLERFEEAFGRANWDITFTLPVLTTSTNETAVTSSSVEDHEDVTAAPSIRLVILNNMNLDGPALSSLLQQQTYSHINDHFIAHAAPVEDTTAFTLLLTHIPLHKAKGVCVDAPFFSYFPPSREVGSDKVDGKENSGSDGSSETEEDGEVRALQADELRVEGPEQRSIVQNELESGRIEVVTDDEIAEENQSGEQNEAEEDREAEQKDGDCTDVDSVIHSTGDIDDLINKSETQRREAVEDEITAREAEEVAHMVESTTKQEQELMQDYPSPPPDDQEAKLSAQHEDDTLSKIVLSETEDNHLHNQATKTYDEPPSSPTPSPQPTNKHTTYHAILPNGIREQNHLSIDSTRNILKGIFGMSAYGGRKGLILTGHDHEGCDVIHYPRTSRIANTATDEEHPSEDSSPEEVKDGAAEGEEEEWTATRTSDFSHSPNGAPHLREITLRSMMGSYGGNAGLLSLWYDHDQGQWQYGFQTCALGVQHWWWAVHVLDLVVLIVAIIGTISRVVEKGGGVVSVSSVSTGDSKPSVKNVEGHKMKRGGLEEKKRIL